MLRKEMLREDVKERKGRNVKNKRSKRKVKGIRKSDWSKNMVDTVMQMIRKTHENKNIGWHK